MRRVWLHRGDTRRHLPELPRLQIRRHPRACRGPSQGFGHAQRPFGAKFGFDLDRFSNMEDIIQFDDVGSVGENLGRFGQLFSQG